mmetsp:Transcript_10292/g.30555  ORF Transcript_10292/g.30555 Transcript_10292/m.30555 type:complete len:231 (-) Transcript_10292:208-900(-)
MRDRRARSEDEVVVLLLLQGRGRVEGGGRRLRGRDRGAVELGLRGRLLDLMLVGLDLVPQQLRLLLLHDLLHAEELLAVLLVHLRGDVLHDVLDPGDEDVLERVHAPTGHLDLLVQGVERRLQRSELDELAHGSEVGLAARVDDGAAVRNAQGLACCVLGGVVHHLELGEADTCDVILHQLARDGRLPRALHHRRRDVLPGGGPLRPGEREGGLLHAGAHQKLGVDDLPQ